MLTADIDSLKCVDCAGPLGLVEAEVHDDLIVNGLLRCEACSRQYPILDQVGVFFRRGVLHNYLTEREVEEIRRRGYLGALEGGSMEDRDTKRQVAVAENWEYQWETVCPTDATDYEQDTFFGADLFWTFIPLDPATLANKVAFVACGGRGREAYHLMKCGPSRVLVNEIGAEIYSIPKVMPDAERCLVLLRSDLSYHPVRDGVADISICDHALQHVLDHDHAFGRMVTATKKDGAVGICVYSRENNLFMTHFIEPMKIVTGRLPIRVQRFLALPFAMAIFAAIHGIYVPLSKLGRSIVSWLPLAEHMIFWSRNPFWIVWTSCFDFIHAPIVHYFRRSDITSLARDNHLEIEKLIHTHGTTWSLVARKSRQAG